MKKISIVGRVFTLIELLVVIAIIAILASMLLHGDSQQANWFLGRYQPLSHKL